MGLKNIKFSVATTLLMGTFAMQDTLADSYVFITNTTPETVSIQVNHTGSQTLEQGNQWAQEATQLAPYETKRVLRMNRYSGLKSGQTYNFDTVV
ncbi:MAG: phospholipase, partial [Acinetobacter sp.]|nr:phospholipase [Acinetobacter sp.]